MQARDKQVGWSVEDLRLQWTCRGTQPGRGGILQPRALIRATCVSQERVCRVSLLGSVLAGSIPREARQVVTGFRSPRWSCGQ